MKRRKTILRLLAAVFLVIGVYFCAKAILSTYTRPAKLTESFAPSANRTSEPELAARGDAASISSGAPVLLSARAPDANAADSAEPSPTPYESPVDFEALQEINPDIYAWLEIEDTEITYPIVQAEDDDTYYLIHNSDREYSAAGAIFSESKYNSGDMSDPVTILYGHKMRSGDMFGELQKLYTDEEFLEEHPTIRVYTPEEELEYGVFACVPYSNVHILDENDFTEEKEFEDFFKSVRSIRDLNALFFEEYFPESEDQVLILSTCLAGNNSRRFLVMATLIVDEPEGEENILSQS